MPKLPVVSGKQLVKAPEKLGFRAARQRGSHVVMRRGSLGCVIPLHREVAPGTLGSAMNQAGVTIEQLLDALK